MIHLPHQEGGNPRTIGPNLLNYMRRRWAKFFDAPGAEHLMAAVLLGIVYGQFQPDVPDSPQKRSNFIQYLHNLLTPQ